MNITIKKVCHYATLAQWNASPAPEPQDDQVFDIGEEVEYIAHVVGGMVKVRKPGHEPVIIHPSAVEL